MSNRTIVFFATLAIGCGLFASAGAQKTKPANPLMQMVETERAFSQMSQEKGTREAFAAFIAIVSIIVHVYAAIWTRGSVRAMTRGTVTAAWAKHHHPAWYKEVSGGGK